MSEKNEYLEVEELIRVDIPLITVLRRPDEIWIAGAIDWKDEFLQHVATRITEAELMMLRQNRLSLHGASAGKPWREVLSDDVGFRFGDLEGDQLPEDKLAERGAGVDLSLEGVPDAMPELSEVEVLCYYDGPILVVLSDGKDLWLGNCDSNDSDRIRYAASRVTRAEVDAIREERISLRAGHVDRPWFEIFNDGSGYRFGAGYGESYPESDPPLPGVGLIGKEGLPDRLEDEMGALSPA